MHAMNPAFDILGLGCVAVDDILYVADYPPADAKAQVLRRRRESGGLTGTALVAAARLGARCAFAGVLGNDDLSQFAADSLRREGIDLAHLTRRAGARPIHSTIVVDERTQTRNIFFDLADVFGPDASVPSAAVIQSAGAVCRYAVRGRNGPGGSDRAGGGASGRRRFRER